MGAGRVDSTRWQKDRFLSFADKEQFWRGQLYQLRAEREYQVKKNEDLALRIAVLDRELAEYRTTFGPIASDSIGDDIEED